MRQRRSRRGASGREVSNSAAFQTEGRTSISHLAKMLNRGSKSCSLQSVGVQKMCAQMSLG